MNQNEDSQSKSKRGLTIGARCKQLRKEMGKTQSYILENTSAETQATISNLENKGMIGDWVWEYFELLRNEGYNLDWIIVDDNRDIPMKLLKGKNQSQKYLLEQIRTAIELIKKQKDNTIQLKEALSDLEQRANMGDNSL